MKWLEREHEGRGPSEQTLVVTEVGRFQGDAVWGGREEKG